MRATLNIPDELINEVQQLTREDSKTRAIIIVMEDFIKRKRIEKLLSLQGKVSIDYDWEKEEARELKLEKQEKKLLEK